MQDVMLSIYVATYNHEKYIRKALDSILMQKTKYTYEVLVGEDCSPDGTREILKEYEEKYPGKFKMFYREKNMIKEVPSNVDDLRQRCVGKYIIALEGDDYWTDEYKLEKQINFLEEHPEYIAVSHKCMVVDEVGKEKKEKYQECEDNIYTMRHLANNIMPGQLATVMYRNVVKNDKINMSLTEKGLIPGDRLLFIVLLCNGRIYCLNEQMSAYRHITNNGTSYSATHTYDFKEGHRYYTEILEYVRRYGNGEMRRYCEYMYFRNLVIGIIRRQENIREFFLNVKIIERKLQTIVLFACSIINRYVLKRKIYV